jgi:Tfp pilus assembly PilM family ATPase
MAQAELCRMTKLGADAFEMACWDVPAPARANPATHLMAVAVRHSDAEAMLVAFEAGGLNVCGLDVQGCAMARACAPRAGASGALAVLDIGWSGGLLVVMQGGVVIYQRRLTESGLAGLHGGMVKEISLSPAVADFVLAQIGLEGQAAGEHGELKQLGAPGGPISRYCDALAGEVTLSLTYIAHRYPELKSEGLLLIGGGASIPGIEQYLSQRLNRAVKRCPPVELVECPGHLADKCGSAALTTALGLAQYGKG